MIGRDIQKDKVYAAEYATSAGYQFSDFESVVAFVESVTASDYWHKRCGGVWPVVVAKGRKNASKAWGGDFDGAYTVELPEWAWTVRTILHELAHVLTTIEMHQGTGYTAYGHGPTFTANHLSLIGYIRGASAAESMRASYLSQGVEIGALRAVQALPFDGLAVDTANGAIVLPAPAKTSKTS